MSKGIVIAVLVLAAFVVLAGATRPAAQATSEPLSPAVVVIHTVSRETGVHIPNAEYWIWDTDDNPVRHGWTDGAGMTDPFALEDGTYYFYAKKGPCYGKEKEYVSGSEDVYIEMYCYEVGGIAIPVDTLSLLAPQTSSVLAILFATVATSIYVKRVKTRKT